MGGKRQRWQRKQQDRARHFPFLRGWLGPGVEHVRAGSPLSPRAGCLAPWRGPKGGSEPWQRVVLVGQHRGRAGFVLRYLYHTNAPLTAAAAKGWARLRHRSCAGLRGPRAAQTLVPAGGHTECLWAAADTSTTAPLDVRGRRLCRGASPHLRSALCWGAQRADFAFSSKPSVFERVFFSNSVSLCEASPR